MIRSPEMHGGVSLRARRLLAALLLMPTLAAAQTVTPARRAAATAAAIVPGIVAHGAGHFVAKQPKTGARLLLAEGVALGTIGGTLTAVALTGAARRFVGPLAAGTVLGVGLFTVSLLADVYGVAMPDRARGRAALRAPWLTTEAGVFYRYDPQFAGRFLLANALEGVVRERHRLRLELLAIPAGDAMLRARGSYGARVWRDRGGSFVDLEGALVHQRAPNDGFYRTTFEAALRARLDLVHVGPTLRGAYAEARLGTGVSLLRARDIDDDADSLLLARFAAGAYVGKGRGEVELFYDHRRDTIAGGIVLPAITAGYLGYLGARALYFVTPRFGVQADLQLGSAALAGVSIVLRQGGSP